MEKHFYEGQQLLGLFRDNVTIVVGECDCISIEVVMESGQMAGVPWALCTYSDDTQSKVNLAMVDAVLLT